MKIAIIIPAYNEAAFISLTLNSLLQQTCPAQHILVVDDNSTDGTAQIVKDFALQHPSVSLVTKKGKAEHLPGSKVIQAFNYGLNLLKTDYDIICKFDADLIFPPDYLEQLVKTFTEDSETGIAGGFCSVEHNGKWAIERLTGKDHIRGALKAYNKVCFEEINGLKTAMGWDTIDELLAQYHGWKVKTIDGLLVRHLKPTGHTYSVKAKYKQGEAFYGMRYGLVLTFIASGKLAWRKKSATLFFDYLSGYLKAKSNKKPFLVSDREGQFIRELRWQKISDKIVKCPALPRKKI